MIREIEQLNKDGKPVLVGTRSIDKSEVLGLMLKRKGIPHNILNAKYHEKEAYIIAQAGRKGAVTIATNMAGRGVDIVLGGNPPDEAEAKEVKEIGGLHIIGTERHESRRIDNQLRGRSGRQGDPGSSKFYVSLDDDLMRLFGSDRISYIMEKFNIEDDIPIEHGLITKGIENAQAKVESRNFDIRKSVLEYDEVMNKQREVIYGERKKVLLGYDLRPLVMQMMDDHVSKLVDTYASKDVNYDQWDIETLFENLKELMPSETGFSIKDLSATRREELKDIILNAIVKAYEEKENKYSREVMRQLERYVLLQMIDTKWIDHLYAMDILKEGIGLRAYGQKDPRIEYNKESFEMFESLKANIKDDTIKYLFKVQLVDNLPNEAESNVKVTGTNRDESGKGITVRREDKIGRNEPCPCGSGKKYKKCCGNK